MAIDFALTESQNKLQKTVRALTLRCKKKLMIVMAAMLCSATLLNAQDAASPEKVGDKVLVMKVSTYGAENSESILMNNTNEELQQMIDVEYPGVYVVRLGTLGEVTEVSDYWGDAVAKVKFEGFEKALWVLSDHLWLQDEYVAKFGGLPGHER